MEPASTVGGCCTSGTLKAWVPVLSWLPRYNLRWLQMDLLAGLTVGLTTVPQALAYAEVAALPVQVNDCSFGVYFVISFGVHGSTQTIFPPVWALLCFHGRFHLHPPRDLQRCDAGSNGHHVPAVFLCGGGTSAPGCAAQPSVRTHPGRDGFPPFR